MGKSSRNLQEGKSRVNEKILVTGGSGLLGRAVSKLLTEAVCLNRQDGDLRDPAQVKALFEKHRPDRVLHLAAKVGGVKANSERNADFYSENILINVNVLNAAKNAGVKRMISLLSSCAYRTSPERASTEEDLHEGLPYEGNLGYGISKRMLEIQSRLISKQYGFEYSTLTPVTMFGPHDNFNLETGHVVASLIHRCFDAKRTGGALKVWGSGLAVRQFVYVKDVARLLCDWIQQGSYHESVIMTPDEGITIRDLAFRIAEAIDFNGAIHFDTSCPEGQKIRRLTSSRFRKLFPVYQFTAFKIALQETVSWYAGYALGKESCDV